METIILGIAIALSQLNGGQIGPQENIFILGSPADYGQNIVVRKVYDKSGNLINVFYGTGNGTKKILRTENNNIRFWPIRRSRKPVIE